MVKLLFSTSLYQLLSQHLKCSESPLLCGLMHHLMVTNTRLRQQALRLSHLVSFGVNHFSNSTLSHYCTRPIQYWMCQFRLYLRFLL